MLIRDETPADAQAVRAVIADAFRPVPYSRQTEVAIHDGLLAGGGATVALVAEDDDGAVIGQIMLSPVTIAGTRGAWLGAGPVAVRPDRQRQGVGRALVEAALERARALDVAGCVLVGDPAFYRHFGFGPREGLCHEGVPDPFVLAISFGAAAPSGVIRFHPAFNAA